jgi:hypothetical protein
MSNPATCAGVASPRITTSNAAVTSSGSAERPARGRAARAGSAAAGSAVTTAPRRRRAHGHQALGQPRVRRESEITHRQQAHAFHDRPARTGPRFEAVRQVHHPHEVAVVDERERDEAPVVKY